MVEGPQTIIDTVRSKSNGKTSDKSEKERAKRRQTTNREEQNKQRRQCEPRILPRKILKFVWPLCDVIGGSQ